MGRIEGHGGDLAVNVARGHGVETMFTLSGGHVFPLYDGAVRAQPPMRLVDVRHEQTAVFAAEASAKLTRKPGLAVLTAGPGVTNGISGVATAHFNGSPLLVLGGRAPQGRWGTGSLQEIDHPPLLEPITKHAGTVPSADQVASGVDAALRLATAPHRGPVFLDVPLEHLFDQAGVEAPQGERPAPVEPDPDAVGAAADALARAQRPVLVLGSDVWTEGAEQAAREAAEELAVPVITNGMGRGVLPSGHEQLVTRARSTAFGLADLVIVAGSPLDFRLGYGHFGGKDGAPRAEVVHLADSADQLATHVGLAAGVYGDFTRIFTALAETAGRRDTGSFAEWRKRLRGAAHAAVGRDRELMESNADPIHPARIYGELRPMLGDDAVVIGDGGDFVSFAGKFIEPSRPGCWLDPRPVRLPRHRARLRGRGPPLPAVGAGRVAARRRSRGLLSHGRGHAGAP